MRIRYRWIWSKFTGPAMICLAWNCFLVGFYWGALRAPERPMFWLSVIFTIPHVAGGLLLIYATLAGLLNRTVITITSESLTVRVGPVPWWGNRTLPVDELDRLYCGKASSPGEDKESGARSVYALTKGGSTVELVLDLATDPDQALFIIQEVERWLKIGPHSAGREACS